MSNKRIRYIDYMKAFGIFFVILGHANFANEAVKAWIYSFHMPLFFFATGMLQKDSRSSGKDLSAFFRKNLWRLVVPFLLWGLIYASFDWKTLAMILYGSHQMIGSAGSLSSLWFLPVMFLSLTLFRLLCPVFQTRYSIGVKLGVSALCFTVSAILPKVKIGYPWGVDVAINALAFLILGNVAARPINRAFKSMRSKRSILIAAVLAMSACFCGTFLYRSNVPEGGYVNMANAVYGVMPLYVLTALCGIGFVLIISLLCDAFSTRLPLMRKCLSAIGQQTFCIMMVHKPIIALFRYVFSAVRMPQMVELFITGIGVLLISACAGMILDRFLPVLTGKGMMPAFDKKN